jgi:hypothetical protein
MYQKYCDYSAAVNEGLGSPDQRLVMKTHPKESGPGGNEKTSAFPAAG